MFRLPREEALCRSTPWKRDFSFTSVTWRPKIADEPREKKDSAGAIVVRKVLLDQLLFHRSFLVVVPASFHFDYNFLATKISRRRVAANCIDVDVSSFADMDLNLTVYEATNRLEEASRRPCV